jgi:hypothetical protein
MMSRMNWMTYLKVLFDKLTQNQYSMNVDVYNLLESLQQIKNLLPLQYKDEYACKHGQERGFTVNEVENSLKKFLIVNVNAQISWDDVIDMFLSNKIQSTMGGSLNSGIVARNIGQQLS